MNFAPCKNFPNDPEHMHLLGKPCPKCGTAGAQQAAQAHVAVSPVVAPVFHTTAQAGNLGTGSIPIAVISFLVKAAFSLTVGVWATFKAFMAHVARFSASRAQVWEKVVIWAAAITLTLLICGLVGWVVVEAAGWISHLVTTCWQNTTAWLEYQWDLFTYKVEMAVDRFMQWLMDLLNRLMQLIFTIAVFGFGGFLALQALKKLTK